MDEQDVKYMDIAIEQATQDPRVIKVGAVVVKDGKVTGKAHGAEIDADEHAEYTVFERILNDTEVRGATLYTTLEPCTRTYHPTNPRKTCQAIIASRGIRRVVIGIKDPNPHIYGTGERLLKRERIDVEFVPDELQGRIKALMKDWVDTQRTMARIDYGAMFSQLENERSPEFSELSGFAVGSCISLRICPDIRNGWPAESVDLVHDSTRFSLPHEFLQPYKDFFEANYDEKGLTAVLA